MFTHIYRLEGLPDHVVNDLPIRGMLDVHIEGEQESEEEIEEVLEQHDQERNLVTEKKSICFERELLQLASLKAPSKCDRKSCDGSVHISPKYVGSSVQLKWV